MLSSVPVPRTTRVPLSTCPARRPTVAPPGGPAKQVAAARPAVSPPSGRRPAADRCGPAAPDPRSSPWPGPLCACDRRPLADLPDLLQFADELRDQLLPAPAPTRRRGRPPRRPRRAAGPLRRGARRPRPPPRRRGRRGRRAARHGPVHRGERQRPARPAGGAHEPRRRRATGYQRRGAGKALVAAVTAFAEERGLDQIVVSVHPGSREANRFFARLGFAPLAVRRVAPVAVVRRRLSGADVRPPSEHVVRAAARARRPPRHAACTRCRSGRPPRTEPLPRPACRCRS